MGEKASLKNSSSIADEPKKIKDYSFEADEALKRANMLINSEKLDECLESLFEVEKLARRAYDTYSVSKVCEKILVTCRDKKGWQSVADHVLTLTKKPGQLKKAIIEIVHLLMLWIEEIASQKIKLQLIDVLSKVTQGKIFLEVERARIFKALATLKEINGNLEEAAEVLQEIQVETYGSMDVAEKTNYILEQMRLVLKKGDLVRFYIISQKIQPKLLERDEFEEAKLKYYHYMIDYFLKSKRYFDVAQAYETMLSTPKIQNDVFIMKQYVSQYIMYLLLTFQGEIQYSKLHTLDQNEKIKLDIVPLYKELVYLFTTPELIQWPLNHESDIQSSFPFAQLGGDELWDVLRRRVIQHNIRILDTYYSKIKMETAAKLLTIKCDELEVEISELVVSGVLHAKIDRPSGIIHFLSESCGFSFMTNWSSNIFKALNFLEESHFLMKAETITAKNMEANYFIGKSR